MEDRRCVLLLELISSGMDGHDAMIAIDLEEDILSPRNYTAGPVEYVGEMPPIEETWAKLEENP